MTLARLAHKRRNMSNGGEEFKAYIRDIPDFPAEGIIFRDITNLLKDGEAFRRAIDRMTDHFRDEKIDIVCSVEARGFILGAAIAYALGAGFVPIRKTGKLPWNTHQASYDLEYGEDQVEIHTDALGAGHRVLLVDDVIATGGTMQAAVNLVEKMEGKVVCAAFLIELLALEGRKKLANVPVYALIEY
jgi:adenine phosphoribosyltransferase